MRTLSGWKEIATHLNQGVRTAQRWELLGLPVHRMGKGKRAQVVAFAEELDAWERAAPKRLLDEIIELKSKIGSLEGEVVLLKRQLRGSRASKSAREARVFSDQAKTSSARHSRDLDQTMRGYAKAAEKFKQVQERRRTRESRKTT